MTRYLISFDACAMDHIPDEDGPAVGKAAHAVVQEAGDSRLCGSSAADWEISGRASWTPTGRSPAAPYPEAIGGFAIVDVLSREEALAWAAKIALASPLCATGPGAHARPRTRRDAPLI